MDTNYETVKLTYSIHKCSSYSGYYVPENIMVDNSTDQMSRWFTDSNVPSQYVLLKLEAPAIVETIKLGKYMKAHVSDLKKFQVYGGTDENNLSLLLTTGLKKDSVPETFRLRHRTSEGLYLPVTYIKIVPLQSWGPAYNYTIWYVELRGKNNPDLLSTALDTVNLRKEEESVRLVLKHLRRRGYKDAFEALSRESGVRLEGALQARLWNALVENGDYKHAEEILDEAMAEGELEWYTSWQPYVPQWRLMSACSGEVEARLWGGDAAPAPRAPDLACPDRDLGTDQPEEQSNGESVGGAAGAAVLSERRECDSNCCMKPGPRGGHQLVVDPNTGTLYLFGGWNGVEDLDDLWSFCTTSERWTLLCRHSQEVGGPSPRSCHKMVFDPIHRKLYTLGRYLDNAQRIPKNMKSELFVYDVCGRGWELRCADAAAAGGPRLVFDHQMCIDPDAQTIYVFGGRVLPANTEEVAHAVYSGLYAYYINTGTWQQLLSETPEPGAPQPRVSHSMLFHPVQRRLYIFAGQRNKEHLIDLWWYDVHTAACGALCAGSAACAPPAAVCHPPAAGFTQRATLDPDTDEMFVLSGMSKEKEKRVHNALWVVSLRRGAWGCVYRNESVAAGEPRPRFAHQLVLDPHTKIHYLFGGNPGNQFSPRIRLDDLWSLRLTRPGPERAAARARCLLREARYRDLCNTRPAAALHYLRTDLSEVLDHQNPAEVARFHKLASALFTGPGAREAAGAALTPRRVRTLSRRRARATVTADLAHAIGAVLGAEDMSEPPQPFEEVSAPPPDTWDVGDDSDDAADDAGRAARVRLYDQLCVYFRPSTVPPHGDIADLVKL